MNTWKNLRTKVARIRSLYLTELVRVGIKQKLRTGGRRYIARRVTIENN